MITRLAVIGDVHGEYHLLAQLIDALDPDTHHIVFVGDLIDRGPMSSKVLELVCRMQTEWTAGVTVLRGNHEHALLEFLEHGRATQFIRNGGLVTIASYQREPAPNILRTFREQFPKSHLDLITESKTHMEDGGILISHMGYNPRFPEARDLRNMVLTPHLDLFEGDDSGPALTICGHYARRNGRVFDSGRLVCVDTGCGTLSGAPLSAVIMPERRILQMKK